MSPFFDEAFMTDGTHGGGVPSSASLLGLAAFADIRPIRWQRAMSGKAYPCSLLASAGYGAGEVGGSSASGASASSAAKSWSGSHIAEAFLEPRCKTSFAKKGKNYEMVKIGKDGSYEYKHGEVIPSAKCLIQKGIDQLKREIDDLEEEIEDLRSSEGKAMKKEAELDKESKKLADPNHPHRMPEAQEANAAGQANAQVNQDTAIIQVEPLLKRKETIMKDLTKLEDALEKAEEREGLNEATLKGDGKKPKKEKEKEGRTLTHPSFHGRRRR